MGRRKFSREFKLEAVKLVRDRGVAVVQACRDLDLAESVLRRRMRETEADPRHAFPGHGQAKPGQQEIDRLRREGAKIKAECDIIKMGRSVLREGCDMRFAVTRSTGQFGPCLGFARRWVSRARASTPG